MNKMPEKTLSFLDYISQAELKSCRTAKSKVSSSQYLMIMTEIGHRNRVIQTPAHISVKLVCMKLIRGEKELLSNI